VRTAFIALAGMVVIFAGASCSSDDPNTEEHVENAAAVAALVDWAAGEMPPEVDDNGEVEQPIVYVATETGGALDAGLQASVVEATADEVTVRFADDRSEAVDDATDDLPVHDDGVMLVIGDLPEPAPSLTVDVEWYRSLDDTSNLVVTIHAGSSGAIVTDSTSG